MEKMSVLVVEPRKAARMAEIDSGLESLQKMVGGYIEIVYPYEDQVGLIVNDEGKIQGLPLNRAVYDGQGKVIDIIAGTFLVAGLTEDDFCSLTPELAQKYRTMFYQPEIFYRSGDEIRAAKMLVPEDLAKTEHGCSEPER